jgi:oxygen-independent coproporphyrinogen-3 oxidase
MAGIYIHIPFCKKACHYCNFHFSTSLKLKNQLLACMLKEIELQKNYLSEIVETIYFGGGTPSILDSSEIDSILQIIFKTFKTSSNLEITLEANPDDISASKLNEWKLIGVNRFSLGVQSFLDKDLLWMNRNHNAKQSIQSIQQIQKAGFLNFTIDLIYGTPHLSNDEWKTNIQISVENNIPHISAYALTVEPNTALDFFIKKKKINAINAEKQATQFEILMDALNQQHYEHYEISNFAKPGFRSKHNSSYWKSQSYLGIGPSAHSYNFKSRQWNIANNALYIKSIEQNIVPFEIENLTTIQKINEYLMISLRTIEGCSLQFIENKFGENFLSEIKMKTVDLTKNQLIEIKDNHIVLTTKGKLLADKISVDLFFEEN